MDVIETSTYIYSIYTTKIEFERIMIFHYNSGTVRGCALISFILVSCFFQAILIPKYQNLPSNPDIYLMTPSAAFLKEDSELAVYDINPKVVSGEIRNIILDVELQMGLPVIGLYNALS